MSGYVEAVSQSLKDAIFSLGANFLAQGKYDKALTIFDGLLALDPDYLSASIAVGEVLLINAQYDQALDRFNALIDHGVRDGRIYMGAAKAYSLLGQHDEAKKIVQSILNGDIPATKAEVYAAKMISES